MVVTRQEAKTIFDHILDQVISRHGTNDLKTALVRDGVDDLFSLLNIDDATIDDLQYPDPNDATNLLEVRRSDKSMIKLWRDYVLYRESKGDPIGDNWLQVTQESFDEFRLSSTNVARLSSFATTLPTMSVSPGTTTASKFSKVDLFRKGIKRDPSLFPTLKDEKFNDSWHRSFMTQARAQDVDKVLDESYVPGTQEEKELFAEQQKYIYAVLESKVLTDVGKSFVREHEKDYDAQAVYGKLKAHHLKSTKAMIESSTILSYVTSARLGNGEWKGTTEGFVLHWQNQVRLYERQVPPTDHFSDGQKRVMLENAVHGITELRQVKNNADLEKTKTGIVLSYDQYASLLLSAAAAYDTQFGTKNSNRHVFNHEIYDWDNNETVDGDSFDIETPVTTIQAYASVLNKIRSNMNSDMKPRMSKEKWYALSEKERLIWDQLDDKAKSIILGIGNNGPPTTASIQDKTSDLNTETKANLHGMSAYDFIQANLHDLGPENGEKEIAPETDDSVNPNEANRIKADKSSTSKLPPGDIRRVLSKSSTRSANMVTIVYNTSALNASGFNDLSLVDRGANGGIAGDDVRVMFKNDHTVNICGIDKHQIADIEIGTVGGVVETHKGPVIAVMHQYALLGKGPSIHSPGQIEHFKNQVDDKSINVGGSQTITTFDGYVIPLTVKDGLVWLKMRPFTDEEYGSLPHVILTDERSWDPSVLDNEVFDKEKWFDWYSKNQATFGSEYLEATPHDKLIGNTSVKSMHYWKEHSVNIVDTEESSIISNKRGVTTFVKE